MRTTGPSKTGLWDLWRSQLSKKHAVHSMVALENDISFTETYIKRIKRRAYPHMDKLVIQGLEVGGSKQRVVLSKFRYEK